MTLISKAILKDLLKTHRFSLVPVSNGIKLLTNHQQLAKSVAALPIHKECRSTNESELKSYSISLSSKKIIYVSKIVK